jgi:hypothetical protein
VAGEQHQQVSTLHHHGKVTFWQTNVPQKRNNATKMLVDLLKN